MPVVLLAHRDPQLRTTLGAALCARGFTVTPVESVDEALDAAADAIALLVEPELLREEELEVKTRLELRAGRPVRILALTHRGNAEQMSVLRRHGAGLLSRPVEDVDRLVLMLEIGEEGAAAPPVPWEIPTPPPPAVAPPATPSRSVFKPAPVAFTPPDLGAIPRPVLPPPPASTGPVPERTADLRPPPPFDANVFMDLPEEPTNEVEIPGAPETSRIERIALPAAPPDASDGSAGKGERTARTPVPPAAVPFVPMSLDPTPSLVPTGSGDSMGWFGGTDRGAAGAGVEPATAGTGPSVLVVDDEPVFRNFLRDALGTQGYRVHTAINGPNALRLLKLGAEIDLVIADLHMPHMDGFELKHEIDKTTGRAMPFIVCTADTSDEKIQTAAQVGAAALVPKPIEDLEAFHAIVRDTLRDAGIVTRTAG